MDSTSTEDDDEPRLSAESLRALQDFYAEQVAAPADSFVTENWQLSQFWYDEETSRSLAEEVWDACNTGDWVACLSCPSLYNSLIKIRNSNATDAKSLEVYLFEYDERFREVAGDHFVQYDYNKSDSVPASLCGKCHYIAADPPFLAADCLSQIAKTCVILKSSESSKLLLCTGDIMEDTAAALLNVKKIAFVPSHKSKLSNTFASFTNYEPAVLGKK